ncbi:MAG: hypothetical protein Q4A34_03855 [Candidatus Saccharibacteria bacterium]|nr:hypothetical protein [Candidatus Saccharibacteria bacterium]
MMRGVGGVEERLVAQIERADKILDHLKHYRPTEKWLVSRCIERTVSIYESTITDTVRSAIVTVFREALREALERVQRELDEYQPLDHAAEAKRKPGATRRRPKRVAQQDAISELSDVQAREVREMALQPGNKLSVDRGQFPWLEGKDDALLSIIVEQGVSCNVAVLDMRTPATLKIEHKMKGYETPEKQQCLLPMIYDKLQQAAQAIADGNTTLSHLKHLKNRDSATYPLPISYWGNKTSNATRIYVSRANVAHMPEGKLKQELINGNIDELLLFLGACDKYGQKELLRQFTGLGDRQLSGVGSI